MTTVVVSAARAACEVSFYKLMVVRSVRAGRNRAGLALTFLVTQRAWVGLATVAFFGLIFRRTS